ncbi:hypothetical protein XB05_17375 [Xanthomonas arboricola]|uniref:hypothetical protein n=1 Tax=Xanthomonas arboricola TaxID=56448 RepID=UPI00061A2E49|nr:hypothetical protein [Xanthomonas arboricola]AKC80320.1 hypothetical protein XB05_17375 [Xanthomonas arboricola]
MEHPAVVLHLTLDQRDQLDRLLRSLIAHGDVIAMSKPECLEAQTLPTLGQAIFDAANAVRATLIGEWSTAMATHKSTVR